MFIREVLVKTTTSPLSYKTDRSVILGNGVCDKNNVNNVEIILLSWVQLLSDSPLGYKKRREVNNFIKFLHSRPLVESVNLMSDLAGILLRSLWVDNLLGTTTGAFIPELARSPISREYTSLRRNIDPDVFTYLFTFLTYGKKAYYEDSSFDDTALRSWKRVEERISGVVNDPLTNGLLAKIVGEIVKDWADVDHFSFKHGPGYSAEGGVKGIKEKNSVMYPDEKIQDYIDIMYVGGFHDTIPLYRDDLEDSESKDEVLPMSESRTKFVPKNLRTSRSIGMEPVPYMWAQQSLRAILEHCITRSFISFNVTISDQTGNRELASYGSTYYTCATIDLEAASDSVRWDLVKDVFPNDFGYLMHLTRTECTQLPDGSSHRLCKYAPMGSAMCFPTQCVIFSAVVILSGLIWWYELNGYDLDGLYDLSQAEVVSLHRRISNPDVFGDPEKLEPFKVYGDDIICDERIVSIVIDLLNHLGFSVNEEKSFTGMSPFRESCGGFYLDGFEVTPFRVKLQKLEDEMSIEMLASVIESANALFKLGYLNTRQVFIRLALYHRISGYFIKDWTPGTVNEILFTDDETVPYAILTDNVRYNHLTERYNDDLQRYEVYSVTSTPTDKEIIHGKKLTPDGENFVHEDIYLYREWSRSKLYGGNKEDFLVGNKTDQLADLTMQFDSKGNRVFGRWTPRT